MAKLDRMLVVTLMLGAPVAACTGGTENNPDSILTAQITGAGGFVAADVDASHTGNRLEISGSSGTTEIIINVPSVTTNTNYPLGVGLDARGQLQVGSQLWSSHLAGGSGFVDVTALSTTSASGNFHFVAPAETASGATGSKTVTGSFTVYFGPT